MKLPFPKLITQISGGDGQFDRRVGAVCPLLLACIPGPFGGQGEDGCTGDVHCGGPARRTQSERLQANC